MKTTKSVATVKRDKTYYSFNGEFFGKSRLVWAIIEKLSHKYTLYQIQEFFNDDFKSTFDIVNTVYEAKKLSINYKRYLINKHEILTDKLGIKFCVCNQLGIGNINPIIKIARKQFGFKIKAINVKR